jgi:hypothetical protein
MLLTGTVTGVSVYNDAGTAKIDLGEQRRSNIIVYNPSDEADTISLTASPSMPAGKLGASIIADGQYTDRTEIQIAANGNRSVSVLYTASLCTTQPTCIGDVTFNARSLETGDTDSETVPVEINHRQEVYGSPGITAVQAILLAFLASAVVLVGQNGRRSRRRSARPDT